MSRIRTCIDGTIYIAKTSRAQMPNSCFGGNNYYHSAVIRVDPGGSIPGCIRNTKTATVVFDSGAGYSGKTDRCAANKNEAQAWDLVDTYADRRNARLVEERTAAYIDSLSERSGECAA